jgi:hypothetical protein
MKCSKYTACYSGPEARICMKLVVMDRKVSNVSTTVKIMYMSITELIWQAKNLRTIHPENFFFQLTTDYNGW